MLKDIGKKRMVRVTDGTGIYVSRKETKEIIKEMIKQERKKKNSTNKN